jgi:hypothetical protein
MTQNLGTVNLLRKGAYVLVYASKTVPEYALNFYTSRRILFQGKLLDLMMHADQANLVDLIKENKPSDFDFNNDRFQIYELVEDDDSEE